MKLRALLVTASVLCGLVWGLVPEAAHAGKKRSITVKNKTGYKLKIKFVFSAKGCTGSTTAKPRGITGRCFAKNVTIPTNGQATIRFKYGTFASKYRGHVLCRWKSKSTLYKVLKRNIKPSTTVTLTSYDSDCQTY